jgi:hypothetical protein
VRENLLVECDGTGGELIDVPENVEDWEVKLRD